MLGLFFELLSPMLAHVERFWRFLAIWLFVSTISKSEQDASQNGLKLVSLGSKMAILGPSWRQVGQLSAILAPTWLILVPRWAPRATFFIPFSEIFGGIAPNLQNATQIVRKSSENCPKNASNMVPKCSEIRSTSLLIFACLSNARASYKILRFPFQC